MASLSLLERLATVPDPRHSKGRVHPLSAILGLTVVALLAGCRSLEAIAQFGRDHGTALAHPLGFCRGKTPCKATLSILLRRLNVAALEEVLAAWIADRHPGGFEHLALDGKVLRGSAAGDTPGVHLLALFAPAVAATVGQLRVAATTNEHKAALRLLGILPPLAGAVVTGDAMFCVHDRRIASLTGEVSSVASVSLGGYHCACRPCPFPA
ncbi:MAG TPA: ISAs1 family transposase [Sporichthyaceae bacterium]